MKNDEKIKPDNLIYAAGTVGPCLYHGRHGRDNQRGGGFDEEGGERPMQYASHLWDVIRSLMN